MKDPTDPIQLCDALSFQLQDHDARHTVSRLRQGVRQLKQECDTLKTENARLKRRCESAEAQVMAWANEDEDTPASAEDDEREWYDHENVLLLFSDAFDDIDDEIDNDDEWRLLSRGW